MNTIYALVDTRDNRIKYVGKTKNLWQRIGMHSYGGAYCGSRLREWKRDMFLEQADVAILELEVVEDEHAKEAEKHWIAVVSQREPLLNVAHNSYRSPIRYKARS